MKPKQLATLILLLSLLVAIILLPAANAGSGGLRTTKLRVMTYNIHVGVGMDKQLDLARIANVIKEQQPALVGLQEVDRGVKRTQGVDEIAELARLTGMQYAFAHNLDYQAGQYGVAILSRFPILKVDHRKYENKREAERRGMLRIEVDLGGRVVSFATTHLDYQYEDGRVFETEQLLKFLSEVSGPLILVGDFNEEPTAGATQLLTGHFRDVWTAVKSETPGSSYPADKPSKRIDYIFFRPQSGIKARRAWVVETLASDHIPVVCELELK